MISNKISRFFPIFKFYRIFWRKFGQKFRNIDFEGDRGAEPPEASEFMDSWVEKSMEICNFWIVLMEFLPFFKFLKEFYRIFRGNCANNLGKYGHMHLYGVRRAELPRTYRFLKNRAWKSIGNHHFEENFMNSENFLFKTLTLIKNKVNLKIV